MASHSGPPGYGPGPYGGYPPAGNAQPQYGTGPGPYGHTPPAQGPPSGGHHGGGPHYGHPGRSHPSGYGPRPDRLPGSTLAVSILWAFVPLLSCGIGTPFIMGHAAAKLKNTWHGISAGVYGLGMVLFWVTIATYDNTDAIPPALDALIAIGFFGSTIGGLIHALVIRASVFRPTPVHGSHTPPPARHYPHSLHLSQHPTHASPGHHRSAHTYAPPSTAHAQGQQTHPSVAATRTPDGSAKPLRSGDPVQVGPYRLVGTLGKGGQGAVYLGLAPDGGKVAVKVLHGWFAGDESAKQRFVREVEAARKVAQFSTARVLDVRLDDESAYIVSEYVDGTSLEQLVRDKGPRDADGLTRLALATAGALAAIHRAGIVHRDFKPANVLIGSDGPRVIDFGIARALDQTNATTGKIIGTPAYMSPEQFASGRVGPASDVFSWAATMIYAASGRTAFGDDTIPAIVNRVLNHQPDIACLPPAMHSLATACLDKNPDNRPAASEIMLAIVH